MISSVLERQLEELPQQVANALLQWRTATLQREKLEAKLYLEFKAKDPESTATTLKAMINGSDERYQAVLIEASFESAYTAKYETLLAAKHLARLREAF